MIGFTIVYADSVAKFIRKLSKKRQIQIIRKLDLLTVNPRLLDIKKLKGYKDTYRVRIGNYRVLVIVNFEKKEIHVDAIGTRKKIEKYY